MRTNNKTVGNSNQNKVAESATPQMAANSLATLLSITQASSWLKQNIEGILNDPRPSIFINQIINALKIAYELQKGNINLGMLAPMQSGKSGTIYFLCNYVLRDINFLNDCEHAAFVTSMRNKTLFYQNKLNLELDAFDYVNKSPIPSNILVYKIDDFFKKPNPYKEVLNSNIKVVVRDEDQYGSGDSSTFDEGFFHQLRMRLPLIPLLSVSATPFDILDARDKGYPINIIEGDRPANYFGITEMLNNGLIEELPEYFNVFEKFGSGKNDIKLHEIIERYTAHLVSFESGIGIVRVRTTNQAVLLRTMISTIYKGVLECIFIGSTKDCDYTISQGIEQAQNMVIKQKKRVFLIIVQALGAGKDFKMLKDYFRFGIETRESQLANVAQGLPGRFCGYHNNRSFKLLASASLLKKYAAFEQNTQVFYDESWRKGIFTQKVFELTTQCVLGSKTKQGEKIKIENIEVYDHIQLQNPETIKLLWHKIGIKNMEKILETFNWQKFERSSGGANFRIKNCSKEVTVRLASSYETDAKGINRLYSNWVNANLESDFASVFSQRKHYKYGILCSNYPVSHPKNTLGICGIMIIESGEKIRQNLTVDIDNESMYKVA
ncbi:MAG: hypothetical protein AB7O73_16010 [Bacteroidia bacterium]